MEIHCFAYQTKCSNEFFVSSHKSWHCPNPIRFFFSLRANDHFIVLLNTLLINRQRKSEDNMSSVTEVISSVTQPCDWQDTVAHSHECPSWKLSDSTKALRGGMETLNLVLLHPLLPWKLVVGKWAPLQLFIVKPAHHQPDHTPHTPQPQMTTSAI